jgi:aspartate carbamoyltransferase catalytic subunit
MGNSAEIRTLESMVQSIGIQGQSLLSINDVSDDQIYGLFHLARALEPWNRSGMNWLSGNVMVTLFYQPSTRTRMSFETAMARLGGAVVTENSPMITSSAAKEESLNDAVKVMSKYANVLVFRHYDDTAARQAVSLADCPVINGGFGDWEHPTQALLDLYTIFRTFGRVEGIKVCVASPDLVAARTGHSMALGLARLGAEVTLASTKDHRTPEEIREKLSETGGKVNEVFDPNQDDFNDLVAGMDYIYLPGCSAPKGEASEAFKQLMDDFFVRGETLQKVRKDQKRDIFITHTLPRREGEMDLAIDASPSQIYFEAIAYSVSLRMALVAAILA